MTKTITVLVDAATLEAWFIQFLYDEELVKDDEEIVGIDLGLPVTEAGAFEIDLEIADE